MSALAQIADVVAVLGGKTILGAVDSPLALHRKIEHGLPYKALVHLGKAIHVGEATIAESIGIPRQTRSRRAKQGRLSAEESSNTYRVGRIVAMTLKVFDDPDKAQRWLTGSNHVLGNEVPIRLVGTDVGAREVEAVLTRMIYGGYS